MNDREEIIKAGLGVVVILLIIVFLFSIWGGKPRGVYWKVEDLRGEIIGKLEQQIKHQEEYNAWIKHLIENHRHTGIYGLPK